MHIENFIRGAVIREIERQTIHDEIFCEIKLKGLRKPSKVRNRFKELIKELGLKQLDVAELTGLSNTDLNIVLNNRRPLSLDQFMLIWISIGCPAIDRCFYIDNS